MRRRQRLSTLPALLLLLAAGGCATSPEPTERKAAVEPPPEWSTDPTQAQGEETAEAVAQPATIAWRRGVDRNPIDVTDPDEARWLESLVWPDHPERRVRLRAAIAEAHADPPPLVRADAVAGVRAAIDDAPVALLAMVVTTWVVFYFDDELRREFEAAVLSADRPTAWLAMEMAGVVPGIDVPPAPAGEGEVSVMTLVSGGAGRPETREFLGFTHPHGAWVDLVEP